MPIQSNPYSSAYLNPFRDVSRNPQAEFRKNYGQGMENHEGLRSQRNVSVSGSQVSCATYNQIMEGDSVHFATDRSSGFLNGRSLQVSAVDDGKSAELTTKEGFLGTSIGAERSHAHVVLKDGENSATFQGNSQRNIALIEVGSGQKNVNLAMGGGDDKAVLYLNGNASGTIFVDGGNGANQLEVHSKPGVSYQLANAKDEGFTPNPGTLTILTQDVQVVRQFTNDKQA